MNKARRKKLQRRARRREIRAGWRRLHNDVRFFVDTPSPSNFEAFRKLAEEEESDC